MAFWMEEMRVGGREGGEEGGREMRWIDYAGEREGEEGERERSGVREAS